MFQHENSDEPLANPLTSCTCITDGKSELIAFITQDQAARDKALQTMASMSSAQIVSASVLHNKALAAAGIPGAFNNENQGYQVCC